jgi:hypothetical protein
LTLAKALTNKTGQKWSNIYSRGFSEGIDLVIHHGHIIVVQKEGRVEVEKLRDGGHGAVRMNEGFSFL